MKEQELFTKLSEIVDTLLGPNGCKWDQKQTLETLRQSVLEETCELIDTIEEKDAKKMNEELGDLLFNVVFIAKIAAKEGHFTMSDTLKVLTNKLIFRHPHVFGDGEKIESVDEVLNQWEALKKQERQKSATKSMLDGIPKTLPALSRAQKLISKMNRVQYSDTLSTQELNWNDPELSEDAFGTWLFEQVRKAEEKGLDAELALRRYSSVKEKDIRQWESDQEGA